MTLVYPSSHPMKSIPGSVRWAALLLWAACAWLRAEAQTAAADFNDCKPGTLQAAGGQTANTGTGFLDAHWLGNTSLVRVIAGDLAAPAATGYAIVPTGTAQSLQAQTVSSGTRRQQYRGLATPLSGEIWGTFLIRQTAADQLTGLTFNVVSIDPALNSSGAGRLYAQGAALLLHPVGGSPVLVPDVFTLGETALVVFRLDTSVDQVEVWINPVLGGTPAATRGVTPAYRGTLDLLGTTNQIGTVGLGGYLTTTTAGSAGVLDALRLGGGAAGYYFVTGVSTPLLPEIVTQPVSQTATLGGSVTFTGAATGAEPLAYQWQKDGVDLPGATATELTLTDLTASDAGSYRLVVANADGTATSNAAVLTLVVPPPPEIVTQPISQTAALGGSVTFTGAATGSAPLTYQWQKDGVDLPGATAPQLTLAGLTAGDAGSYRLVVSNAGGSVQSAAATLTLVAPPSELAGSIAPRADATVQNGDQAALNLNGNGLVVSARGTTSAARKSWLGFDLPPAAVLREVGRASLRLTLSPQNPFIGAAVSTVDTSVVASADVRTRSTSANNQGATNDLAVGPVGANDVFRSLLSFDLSELTTPPAEVAFKIRIGNKDPTSGAGTQTLRLYRLTRPIDEATASWIHASELEDWLTPGGDYELTLLSEASADPTTVTVGQELTFPSTPALVAAVGQALTSEGVLHLVLLSSAENLGQRSFFFFDSREDTGKEPRLVVGAQGQSSLDTGNPVRLQLHAIVDGQDVWTETGLTWNNAPKNATASATGVKSGTALVATATVESGVLAGGASVVFDDPRIAQFLNWAAGRRGNLYGTGQTADPDQRVTFIVTAIDAGLSFPGLRFVDREAAAAEQRPALLFDTVATAPAGTTLENERYRVTLREDLRFEVTDKLADATAVFAAQFEVVHQGTNPGLGLSGAIQGALQGGTTNQVGFRIPSWGAVTDFASAPGTRATLLPEAAALRDGVVAWSYAPRSAFGLRAMLDLPAGTAAPRLHWTLSPTAAQYWTVGYTGAPSATDAEVAEFYVPGIWNGRRFMAAVYLIDEMRAMLPAALQERAGVVSGVVVDPFEMPRRLATAGNSAFALTGRTSDARNRPAAYAPLYGGTGSLADTTLHFTVSPVVRGGALPAAFREVAQTIYGFRDYRENLASGSLNTALENLVDLTLNTTGQNYSYWNTNVKANEYVNDKPGYSRFQSAPTVLALAMMVDDANLYEQRARPSIEYFISRQRQLMKSSGYDPEYPMGGPVSGYRATDWFALASLTGGRTYAFQPLAREALNSSKSLLDQVNHTVPLTRNEALDLGFNWLRSLIEAYRFTQDPAYLVDARHVADAYIAERIDVPPVDFRDVRSSFWSLLTPAWETLLELHDLTGEARYANAAARAAEEFTRHLHYGPAFAGGAIRTVDTTLPAWQLSEVGLPSEAAGTSDSHRAIYMPYASASLLRIARRQQDPWFVATARSGIIGRFLNYPGYTLRNRYNAEFLKASYPLRFYSTYQNTAHMNHPMPMAAMIIDYLMADAEYRSGGAIEFPHAFTDSGAYFRGRLFGHAAGTFYGDTGVRPWLPKGLVTLTGLDASQLNWIAGYGNGRLYLAFANQAPRAMQVTLTLNGARVAVPPGARMRVWRENVAQADLGFVNGSTSVAVSPGGFTVFAIDNATPVLRLQADYANGFGAPLTATSYAKGVAPFGEVVGTVVSLSPARQHAYVYTSATPDVVSTARLRYRIDGGAEQVVTKPEYPFEFTVALTEDTRSFTYVVETTAVSGGAVQTSSEYALQLSVPPAIATAPVRQTVTAGSAVTLSVTAAGPGPFTYQWRKNGVALPGATSDTLVLSGAPGDAGSYDVIVSNGSGSVTSAAAVVTVQLVDLLAYALGATGSVPASTPVPGHGAGGQLSLTFVRARADVTYTVQASADLQQWTDLAVNPGQVGEMVTVTDSVALSGAGRRFLRLQVALP